MLGFLLLLFSSVFMDGACWVFCCCFSLPSSWMVHAGFFVVAFLFRLHGWCMLGFLLLPAFTCLGYECQVLLSLCNGLHVCTD